MGGRELDYVEGNWKEVRGAWVDDAVGLWVKSWIKSSLGLMNGSPLDGEPVQ